MMQKIKRILLALKPHQHFDGVIDETLDRLSVLDPPKGTPAAPEEAESRNNREEVANNSTKEGQDSVKYNKERV